MSTRQELEREAPCEAIRYKATQRDGRITFTLHRPTEFYGCLDRITFTRIGTDIPDEFEDIADFVAWLRSPKTPLSKSEEVDYREPFRKDT
jgi:hypothetical protein